MKTILDQYGEIILENFFTLTPKWKDDIKVFQFLSGIKECNRKQTEELKKFCKKEYIDFRLCKNNLLEVLSTFKRVGVWGNE